jgi:hypothetical protein
MSKNECLDGYFESFRQVLLSYGMPEAIYADGSSIFFSNRKQKLVEDELLMRYTQKDTQFSRVLANLGIKLIHARSPQAKGKIERLWLTLQSRLPVEFEINNITTVDEVNKFLETYAFDFNDEFSVLPISTNSLFVSIEDLNLDTLLCYKTYRKIDRSCCFIMNGILFRVDGKNPPRNTTVEVLVSRRLGGIKVSYHNVLYTVTPLKDKRLPISDSDSTEMIIGRFVKDNLESDAKNLRI